MNRVFIEKGSREQGAADLGTADLGTADLGKKTVYLIIMKNAVIRTK